MSLTASININVPALPDNDVWFANAAAWTNYWTDISGNVTFDPITTTIYAASAYNPGAGVYVINLDGMNEYRLITEEMFTSLLNRLNTLNTAFETMRTELRNAGLITQAQ